jgi:hypothetical protein
MGKNVYAFHVHKILLCFYAFIKESLIIVFTTERLLMLFKYTGTAYIFEFVLYFSGLNVCVGW